MALALPWLEAIAFAQTGKSAGEAPLRMAFLFVPNGINMAHWTPEGEGALGALLRITGRLSPETEPAASGTSGE